MKSAFALAFAALATAAPSLSTRETDNELVWTGDIQDGGPNRTCMSAIPICHHSPLPPPTIAVKK